MRVNIRGTICHVDVLVVGARVALGEGELAREVHGTDERHEFDVVVAAVLLIIAESRDVGCAAVHVPAVLHAAHLIVQFGAAVAARDADGQAPMFADGVEHVVRKMLYICYTRFGDGVVNPKRHGCVAMGKFGKREVFHTCLVFSV